MSDTVSENQTEKSGDYQNGHQDIRLAEGSPKSGIINPVDTNVESSTKRTWVKFDDETEGKENTATENTLSNALSTTETHLTKAPTTTSLVANKLSPPPPSQRNMANKPAVQQRQRSPSSQITTTRSISPVQVGSSPKI